MDFFKNEDIKSVEYLKNVFKIKWRLTGWCNYSCWYCINGQNKERHKDWNSNEVLINRATKINELLIKNNITKPIHLSLIGGEVTFLDLKSIVSKIDNISNLNITTNFSKPVEFFEDLFLWCRERNITLFLHCSYHKEATNYKEKLLSLTNWCKENKFATPRGSVVIGPDDNAEEILQEYYDYGLTKMVAQRMKLLKDDSLVDLSDEGQASLDKVNTQYEKINPNMPRDYRATFKDGSIFEFKSMSDFLSRLDNNGFIPNNYKCYSGINSIVINWDGGVYRTNCYELDFRSPLGNVDCDNIKLPTEPYICKNTSIRCCLKNGTSVYKIED